MSVGPLGGILASAAGTSAAQAKGSETERVSQDSMVQQRQVRAEFRADAAAGIGQTDGEDHQASERDADGRSPWKRPEPTGGSTDIPSSARPPASKDATGESGTQLDLSG